MKKPYTKPQIAFEEFSLDMPIAGNCSTGASEVVKELKAQDYFSDDNCYDQISDDTLDVMYGDDKICYYTLADMLFTS